LLRVLVRLGMLLSAFPPHQELFPPATKVKKFTKHQSFSKIAGYQETFAEVKNASGRSVLKIGF
jgi:hypothetical protein